MLLPIFLGLVVSTTVLSFDLYNFNNGFAQMENRMDTFWSNFNNKMDDFRKRMENMGRQMKKDCTEVNGNEYKIIIKLPGFNTEDILVKVREGQLTVKAIHDVVGEPLNSFLYTRGLPEFVDGNGTWSYKGGVFKIVFNIKHNGYSPAESGAPSDFRARSERCDVIVDNDISSY